MADDIDAKASWLLGWTQAKIGGEDPQYHLEMFLVAGYQYLAFGGYTSWERPDHVYHCFTKPMINDEVVVRFIETIPELIRVTIDPASNKMVRSIEKL